MDKVGRRTKKVAVVELAEDILIDIMFRLPVKSLLKFKTVCKSWCSIISSTEFVKRHLNHAQSIRYNQHKDVLGLLIPYPAKASQSCVLYNIENSDGVVYAKKFDFPFRGVEVCNYCDGLICFNMSGHSILLWNPSFPREHKIIPMECNTESLSELGRFCVGMGYDSATDDYKIVRVPKSSNQGLLSFVEVFSQKRRLWSKREIRKNFTYKIRQEESIYSRNCLHWIGRNYDDGGTEVELIVYFDMVQERLDHTKVPCESEYMFNYKDTLAIKDGSSLWVLVDYNGMKSSWNKFQLAGFERIKRMDLSIFFCCITRDGKILIRPWRHGGLITYDPENGCVTDVLIRGDSLIYQKQSLAWFYTLPYVESLVSPRWFD